MEKYLLSVFANETDEKKMTQLIEAQTQIYLRNFQKRTGINATRYPGWWYSRLGCFKRVMRMKEKGLLIQKSKDDFEIKVFLISKTGIIFRELKKGLPKTKVKRQPKKIEKQINDGGAFRI